MQLCKSAQLDPRGSSSLKQNDGNNLPPSQANWLKVKSTAECKAALLGLKWSVRTWAKQMDRNPLNHCSGFLPSLQSWSCCMNTWQLFRLVCTDDAVAGRFVCTCGFFACALQWMQPPKFDLWYPFVPLGNGACLDSQRDMQGFTGPSAMLFSVWGDAVWNDRHSGLL